MYYVGCLPQSLTPCSSHYRVLPSVVHDMCNVIIHVIKSPPSKLLRHSMLMKYTPYRCCLDLQHFGTLTLVGALLVDGVWLSVCTVMVDMMNTSTLQCTTVARC